jgi:hypothetical protein
MGYIFLGGKIRVADWDIDVYIFECVLVNRIQKENRKQGVCICTFSDDEEVEEDCGTVFEKPIRKPKKKKKKKYNQIVK